MFYVLPAHQILQRLVMFHIQQVLKTIEMLNEDLFILIK